VESMTILLVESNELEKVNVEGLRPEEVLVNAEHRLKSVLHQ
jgi:hypothetical protein